MLLLGISGRRNEATAALARNGRVVAAAAESVVSREQAVCTAFPVNAVRACLGRANVSPEAVDRVVLVSGHRPVLPRNRRLRMVDVDHASDDMTRLSRAVCQVVDEQTADALQFGSGPDAGSRLVLTLDAHAERDAAVFLIGQGCRIRLAELVVGWADVVRAARRVAATFGLTGGFGEGLGHRASFAAGGERGSQALISWTDGRGFAVDEAALERALATVHGSRNQTGAAGAGDSLNVRAIEGRRGIAAALQSSAIEAVVCLARTLRARAGVGRLGLAGSLFANSWIATGVVEALGSDVELAALPDEDGRALGAALLTEDAAGEDSLSLGPAFTEQEVKQALDVARLDYVYDPDWDKLIRRVSALLVRGKTVAWVQGPADFGPRSLGARSVLADPSDRFARDNILRFLKGRSPDEEGLALSLRDCDADECLLVPTCSPRMLLRGTVLEAWRNRLRAALDPQHSCRVHTVPSDAPSRLSDLLRVHRERWGGAGLINATLADHGEPMACSPRDALRTFYSSAIDALVIGRFLLMKDYWLLRSDVDR